MTGSSRNRKSVSTTAVLLSTSLGICAASLAPLAECTLRSPHEGARRKELWGRSQRHHRALDGSMETVSVKVHRSQQAESDELDRLSESPCRNENINSDREHHLSFNGCDIASQEGEDTDPLSSACSSGSEEYNSEESEYGRSSGATTRVASGSGSLVEESWAPSSSGSRSFADGYPQPHPFLFNSNSVSQTHSRHHRPLAPFAAVGGLAKIATTIAVALAAIAPLAQALSSHWPYFVAGGICAAVSHTAAVPLDVIKTRIQCAEPGEYRGTFDAMVRICRSEGAQVLFCGASATLVGYAMQGFLKFGFFEFLKPYFSSLFVGGGIAGSGSGSSASSAATPVLGSLVAASITAEVVGSSALTPLEAARIRMVADAEYAPGLRSGIARMISEEGVGALTRGLPAVLAKQIPYTVTKLVTFDILVRSASKAARYRGGGGGSGGGVGVTLCCAVVAGILSSLASQPGDSLLSTLNSQSRGRDGGALEEPVAFTMARIARDAGFFGLFRGTAARMMHVTSIVTVQLLIYQSVKRMVGIRG